MFFSIPWQLRQRNRHANRRKSCRFSRILHGSRRVSVPATNVSTGAKFNGWVEIQLPPCRGPRVESSGIVWIGPQVDWCAAPGSGDMVATAFELHLRLTRRKGENRGALRRWNARRRCPGLSLRLDWQSRRGRGFDGSPGSGSACRLKTRCHAVPRRVEPVCWGRRLAMASTYGGLNGRSGRRPERAGRRPRRPFPDMIGAGDSCARRIVATHGNDRHTIRGIG